MLLKSFNPTAINHSQFHFTSTESVTAAENYSYPVLELSQFFPQPNVNR